MSTDATPDATPARRARIAPARQEKPYPGFPLFWHARGYWCCKRDGRQINYTSDWKESLSRFEADEKARKNGAAVPSLTLRGYTVDDAKDLFLTAQLDRHTDEKIGDVQMVKYRKECTEFADVVGRQTRLLKLCGEGAPAIFRKAVQAAMARGLIVAERHVCYVRKMLEVAAKRGYMPPPNYGESFDPPTPEQVARAKIEEERLHGERAWSVNEIREIVAGCHRHSPQLFAQCLLGINCGFGADDCSLLEGRNIDRDRGLIRAHRGKTLRKRVSPYWPVTLWAIHQVRWGRPPVKPRKKEWADRIFLTDQGKPVVQKHRGTDDNGLLNSASRTDTVAQAFDGVLEKLELKRYKTGFYTLRAMFRSAAVGCGVDNDLIAVIKGQKFQRPVDEYYLRGDLRSMLFKVTDHVFDYFFRGWQEPWPWQSKWPRGGTTS